MIKFTTILGCLLIHSIQGANGQVVPLHGESVIEFASSKQAKAALAKEDVFVKAMSKFDRQSRMQVDGDPSVKQYLEFVQEHVVEWPEDQLEKLTVAIKSAAEKMKKYKIPFPKKILLITTDGKEEAGAAYCRGPAVILPQNMVSRMSARALERLLIHELFHVLSNQNPDLRKQMYAIIGFQPCGEIAVPQALVDRKLTNPDGPTLDYYVEIKVDDKPVPVVPFLFAKSAYDAKKGGAFFQYLQFQLMQIEKKENDWQPVLKDGLPVFYPPNGTPSYLDKIGQNTGYIIHPDEVLADNFVFLIQQKKGLKTPQIVEDLGKMLSE